MENIKRYLLLTGRILLSLIFVLSSLSKLSGWEETAGYMAYAGMSMIPLFLVTAIAIELLGGLSILLGFKVKIGAAALVLFLIPVSIIFHDFWTLEGMEAQLQKAMFMKNLSIMGGLSLLMFFGAGPFSIDENRS